MEPRAILMMSFLLSTITYVLIARWYVAPALDRLPRARALTPLLLVHTMRHIGMAFLIDGVVSSGLSLSFAIPAAYGDLAAALLAFAAIAALRNGWPLAIALTWLANVEGTVDLLLALRQGLTYTSPGEFGPTYFIPTLIVPLLLTTHVLIFRILLREEAAGD